jgi:hypothetical protein
MNIRPIWLSRIVWNWNGFQNSPCLTAQGIELVILAPFPMSNSRPTSGSEAKWVKSSESTDAIPLRNVSPPVAGEAPLCPPPPRAPPLLHGQAPTPSSLVRNPFTILVGVVFAVRPHFRLPREEKWPYQTDCLLSPSDVHRVGCRRQLRPRTPARLLLGSLPAFDSN